MVAAPGGQQEHRDSVRAALVRVSAVVEQHPEHCWRRRGLYGGDDRRLLVPTGGGTEVQQHGEPIRSLRST